MRFLLALIFFGLASWRAYLDWVRTIGEGNAYRLASVEQVWQELGPASYDTLMPSLREADTPILWSPLGETLMGLPLALVLFVLAVFFYGIRKRRR